MADPTDSDAAAAGLRARLRWDAADGSIHDGPRRYLMMRPDVLMGTLARLPDPVRAQVQDAFADSVAAHGILRRCCNGHTGAWQRRREHLDGGQP